MKLQLKKKGKIIWKYKKNKHIYIVNSSIIWLYGDNKITIPKGFEFDGGSIPKILFFLDGDNYLYAYVLHDYLYRKGAEIISISDEFDYKLRSCLGCSLTANKKIYYPSRIIADELLFLALKYRKMSIRKCYYVYIGIRLFGWLSFNKKKLGK